MKSCAHLLTPMRRWSNSLRFLCPGPRVSVQEHLRKASRQDWSRNQNCAACSLPAKRTARECLPVKVFFASKLPFSRPGMAKGKNVFSFSPVTSVLASESPQRERKWGRTQRRRQRKACSKFCRGQPSCRELGEGMDQKFWVPAPELWDSFLLYCYYFIYIEH